MAVIKTFHTIVALLTILMSDLQFWQIRREYDNSQYCSPSEKSHANFSHSILTRAYHNLETVKAKLPCTAVAVFEMLSGRLLGLQPLLCLF